MNFDDAVTECERAFARERSVAGSRSKVRFDLGDVASGVEPVYGEATVQQLAGRIGIPYKTLLDYRRVSEAYRDSERTEQSWTSHQIFVAEPDRARLVQRSWTVREARAYVSSRKATASSLTRH